MKIELRGHSFYYEVCQEAKQFFILEKFEQSAVDESDDAYIISTLRPARKKIGMLRRWVVTRVFYEGKHFETRILWEYILAPKEDFPAPAAGQDTPAGGDKIDLSDAQIKKSLCTAIKRCVYLTLRKATGKRLKWGSLCGVRPAKRALSMLLAGKSDKEVQKEFRSYYVSPEKTNLALAVGKAEQKILNQIPQNGISLYLAVPFCPSRCLYCSFYSAPLPKERALIKQYLDALEREMQAAAALIQRLGKKLISVYIGGGTPTSLCAGDLQTILSNLEQSFDFSNILEYTVECGRPDTIDREKLGLLKKYGVSRISINPQSMHQKTLTWLGRSHTPAQIRECYYLAREAGFSDINCDVIAGIPGETVQDFNETLRAVEALSPSNITVHTLSIKRSSVLYDRIGEYGLMPEALLDQMVSAAFHTLPLAGFFPYYLYRLKNMPGNLENVGYAKPGRECVYNVLMMEELSSVIALGAGSVTKYVSLNGKTIRRSFNAKFPQEYVSRIDEMIEKKETLFSPYL